MSETRRGGLMAVPSSPRVPYGGPDLPIEELTRLTRAKDAPVLAAIAAGDVEALQVEGAQVRKPIVELAQKLDQL